VPECLATFLTRRRKFLRDAPCLAQGCDIGRAGVPPAKLADGLRQLALAIRCPALVVHGAEDQVAPAYLGRCLAALLDAPFGEVPGAGHAPQARYPVRMNRLIRRFTEQVGSAARRCH
jgi:pimeloyl-ACP methyl ester carboxylesterase